MEYKNAYERLIEAVRTLLKNNPSDEGIQNWAKDNVPEIFESEDERIRKSLADYFAKLKPDEIWEDDLSCGDIVAWLEKKGEQNQTLPKWKYKNDNTPFLRDSLFLNKYGCVCKAPPGAIVSNVWVIDYDELSKLPKEEFEKKGEQKPADKVEPNGANGANGQDEVQGVSKVSGVSGVQGSQLKLQEQDEGWSEEDEVKINRIVACLENLNVADNDILLKDVDWLKSIKDRYTWKPSDEQIKSIKEAACYSSVFSEKTIDNLISLSKQLKKLREE